jgi:SAM-dependent methyltransferase
MTVEQVVAHAGIMWQHKNEFIPFLKFLQDEKVQSVLEIGTGLGGSAFCFGEITGHGRVVSVDFDQQGAARIDPRKRRTQPNPNFVQITGDSRTDEIEALIAAFAPFDVVYFDTEHPYEDCADNYRRYAKMATRFIVQHDINMDEINWPDAGIPRYWREFSATDRASGRVVEFINPSPDPRFPRWGGLGVIIL